MSFPPPTSMNIAGPLPAANKRHSLNAVGPRPLHLVDGNVPAHLHSPGPFSAPLAASPRPFSYSQSPEPSSSTRKFNSRRQSSISYFPRDSDRNSASSPRSPPAAGRLPSTRSSPKGDRNSTGSVESRDSERPPVTLAEKHADLLHFIAQKESKCLELRSQLEVHEAELLQLKRKWERIVSKGFDRASVDSSPIVSHSHSGSGSNGQGAMLEGIKEGVQGVSRFIAAGLTEFSSPTPSTTPLTGRRHSARQSNSSVSTFGSATTQSTRLSQSSASSIGEASECDTDAQVLMVHDTGATPTMSPNPEFVHAGLESIDTSSKTLRRRSRDHSRAPSPLESPTVKRTPSTGKRSSIHGGSFPLPASIPGLASFGGSQSPSSWVGSVGKRWEELQRGSTFTKGQKRASVLLSDVAQSIGSALASPPIPSSANGNYTQSSPVSLLDDDVLDDSTSRLGTVMTPDSKTTIQPPLQPRMNPAAIKPEPVKPLDDDDEWNW
ncbi:hypothetical protein PLICRDRAFT_495976 [Plicaturopsis crispa FD-325 SS-3]|nr:hypothetical protein PLICRDRAFT_495976 [Plicaturopsis crispa FD-325 SS-3]